MINTACESHSEIGVLRSLDEALISARDLLKWCGEVGQTGWMAEVLSQFSTLTNSPRCCPAAMHATYLANAAYRILLQGEAS